MIKKNNQSFIEPGNLGAERLTGVRILILIICMKVKGCERKLLRTASLEQNNGWPGLQLTAAYVVMTMGCTRVHSKIWKYNCDIRSVVSTQRSPISVFLKGTACPPQLDMFNRGRELHAHTDTTLYAHIHRPLDAFSFNAWWTTSLPISRLAVCSCLHNLIKTFLLVIPV